MDIYEKLRSKDIYFEKPIEKAGVFSSVRFFGENLAYVSGAGPNIEGGERFTGRLGRDCNFEKGEQAAYFATISMLNFLHFAIGDLNKIKQFVKLLVFVNSAEDFYEQPLIANSASNFLCEIFGEEVGLAARSAIGVYVLPGNIPVEIEALVELK